MAPPFLRLKYRRPTRRLWRNATAGSSRQIMSALCFAMGFKRQKLMDPKTCPSGDLSSVPLEAV